MEFQLHVHDTNADRFRLMDARAYPTLWEGFDSRRPEDWLTWLDRMRELITKQEPTSTTVPAAVDELKIYGLDQENKDGKIQFFAKEVTETRLCRDYDVLPGLWIVRPTLFQQRGIFRLERDTDQPHRVRAKLIGGMFESGRLSLSQADTGLELAVRLKEDDYWWDTHCLLNVKALAKVKFC